MDCIWIYMFISIQNLDLGSIQVNKYVDKQTHKKLDDKNDRSD